MKRPADAQSGAASGLHWPRCLRCSALTAGCAVGPRYQKPAATAPTTAVPAAWKTQPPWQQAAPKDAIPKGEWWQVFHDPELDAYEQQLLAGESILTGCARSFGAGSLHGSRASTSDCFRSFTTDVSGLREGAGSNRPLSGATVPSSYTQNVFTVPFNISYEADLFGERAARASKPPMLRFNPPLPICRTRSWC